MNTSNEPKIKQIQIELDEKVSAGEYANLAIITHSPAEFIIDFTQVMPGLPKARVRSRIIMAPLHAKAFALAMLENVKKFESRFGEIKVSREDWLKQFGYKLPSDTLPN